MQVNDASDPVGKSMGSSLKTAFGGAPYQPQIFALSRGVECSWPPLGDWPT